MRRALAVNAATRPEPPVPAHEPLPEPREGYTAVGRVTRAHGLRGEVRVAVFASGAPNLQPGRRAWLGGHAMTVKAARAAGETWILRLDRIGDRATAERFRGHLFEVPDSEVLRESPDSYFVHELIGLRVVTAEGEELGQLVEVLSPGANDVYVVRGPRGEVLVPAIGEVVASIDLPVGVMIITPLPGLLDGSA